MTLSRAIGYIKLAYITAFIVAFSTFVSASYSLYFSKAIKSSYFATPWRYLDVAIVIILALFVRRKSRVAASLLLAYSIANTLAIWSFTGRVPFPIISFALALVFAGGVIGTISHHRLVSRQDPSQEPIA